MNAKRRKGIIALLVTLVLGFLLSFAVPVSAAPSRVISKGNTTEKVVALTFDDGADGTHISSILQTLSSHNVKATFFLTGSGASHHSQQIRNIANQGHQIGNHSYTHPYFTQLTAAQMRNELQRTETFVQQVTGRTTKPFFRPPYGAYNSSVLQTVGDAGYTHTIMWTIDTIDWRGDSAATIVNRVMSRITPGAIILMHTGAGASGTPQALPTIISRLKALGYRFVTISQMLNMSTAPSGQTYVVRAGDTLYRIAQRYGVTVQAIARANGITNINFLSVGQRLIIPGTSTPPPTSPPPAATRRHTVRAGETLYAIARRYGVTVQQIVTANRLSNPNLIRVGQVLVIPGGSGSTPPPTSPPVTRRHTVRAGETLYSIARRYGVTVQRIVTANRLSNPNLIRVGQVLIIP